LKINNIAKICIISAIAVSFNSVAAPNHWSGSIDGIGDKVLPTGIINKLCNDIDGCELRFISNKLSSGATERINLGHINFGAKNDSLDSTSFYFKELNSSSSYHVTLGDGVLAPFNFWGKNLECKLQDGLGDIQGSGHQTDPTTYENKLYLSNRDEDTQCIVMIRD